MMGLLLKTLLFSMATDNLPASEDTRADKKYFEQINTENDTIDAYVDADHNAGDLILWGPYVALVNHNVSAESYASLRTKDGILVTTAQVATGSTFATPSQEVWFDPTTMLVHDTEAAGLYGVGPLAAPMDANGVIGFYKRRYWIESEET